VFVVTFSAPLFAERKATISAVLEETILRLARGQAEALQRRVVRQSAANSCGRNLRQPLQDDVRTQGTGRQGGKGGQESGGKVLAKRKPMLLNRFSG